MLPAAVLAVDAVRRQFMYYFGYFSLPSDGNDGKDGKQINKKEKDGLPLGTMGPGPKCLTNRPLVTL